MVQQSPQNQGDHISVNGTLKIDGDSKTGTNVRFTIPLE